MAGNRIYGSIEAISYAKTLEFFKSRARKHTKEHPLVTVMYQDNNPTLAEDRDRYEKEKISPFLKLNMDTHVLDIGCGIGRWCLSLDGIVGSYTGLDFSPELIEVARKFSNEHELGRSGTKIKYVVGAAQNLVNLSTELGKRINLFFISGVLIYLNDEDCIRTLDGITKLAAAGSQLYIREPVGIGSRLTLREHWSDSLHDHYNAIYRTNDELLDLISRYLVPGGFKLISSDFLFPESFNNRKDTSQYYYILEKNHEHTK